MALLNTHLIVKKFIKYGFSEEQAEVLVEAINDQNTELATKHDISNLNNKMDKLENKINISIKWIMAISVVIIGFLLKNTFI